MSDEQQRMAIALTCSEFEPCEAMLRGFVVEGDVSCSYCQHWAMEQDECMLDIFDSQLASLDQT